MIGKDGSLIRFTDIEDLTSDCTGCSTEKLTRMFCEEHREGRPCNWCGGRNWQVRDGRWVTCNH